MSLLANPSAAGASRGQPTSTRSSVASSDAERHAAQEEVHARETEIENCRSELEQQLIAPKAHGELLKAPN